MTLPTAFCWSKFGVESGESSESIIARKDTERRMNGGTFLWGIGNSIGPSLSVLVERTSDPVVAFTPMQSRAAPQDERPQRVVRWTSATGLDGLPFELPEHSTVISRAADGARGRRHYALVCHADADIRSMQAGAVFDSGPLRNLISGSRVGSSQVTSVVQSVGIGTGRSYSVRILARLVYPYMLELHEPELVRSS